MMRCAMAIVAPTTRTYLCADALFRLGRSGLATIADDRDGETERSFPDALRSACAMFALNAPSLLACDTQRAEGNVGTIYGMAHVPCDTHMREILEPVSPASLRPLCKRVFRQLQRGKALAAMVCLDGHALLARDGTGDFSSPAVHGASCLHTVHRNGSITSAHQRLGVAIIHPDVRAVMPLMPEPIITQDGTANNDGARNAAKRCIATLRQDHPHLKCIITADSLRANAPTSRRCTSMGCMISSGSKTASRPLSSHRCRRPNTLGA
jgi:hypothetical protein